MPMLRIVLNIDVDKLPTDWDEFIGDRVKHETETIVSATVAAYDAEGDGDDELLYELG